MSEAEALIAAFCRERHVQDGPGNRFGNPAYHLAGISDGNEGTQWNAWVKWSEVEQMAYAGVNLEGMKYDGWPVGRFIERELAAPKLLDAARHVVDPHRVEILWYRDAWQFSARPPIAEKLIGPSPQLLHSISPQQWQSLLKEAAECLGNGLRGRVRQVVTIKSGPAEFDVSPHFQFRRAFWPRDATSPTSWQAALKSAFVALEPLYTFVCNQSAQR